MAITLRIPTPLRLLASGAAEVSVEGGTVGEALDSLEARCPGIGSRIRTAGGELRHFINVYVNDQEVRALQGLGTRLKSGDTLSIIPAIAGGMSKGVADLFDEARKVVRETTAADVRARMVRGERLALVDVREADEFRQGYIPGAVHVPRGFLEMQIEDAVADRSAEVVLYCAGGRRSLLAARTLADLGYSRVVSMEGGFTGWTQAGHPVERPRALSDRELARYARHLAIPEVGEKGQARLLDSRVLLIGAGGLGCPAAYYLAAAGVGTLGIVDSDVVEESNLQRQILHTTDRVGSPKVESARKTLLAFNPATRIVEMRERITSANVDRILEGYDLVVDGSDNFPTRYLLNDACVKHRKACVHGSVYRFEGQVTVFDPSRGGPCYRCLYPEPPPPEFAPSCADAGVLGVLPGVIGLLEAVEAVKLLLGIGEPLVGRLLTYDALAAEFRRFQARRNPACAVCGEGRPFPGYVDYEAFCATSARSAGA